jgi:hypothetical protein
LRREPGLDASASNQLAFNCYNRALDLSQSDTASPDAVIAEASRALAMIPAGESGDQSLQARAHHLLCDQFRRAGQFTKAKEHGRKAVRAFAALMATQPGLSQDSLPSAYLILSSVWMSEDNVDQAIAELRECCTTFEKLLAAQGDQPEAVRSGLFRGLVLAYGNLFPALRPHRPDELAEMQRICERSREICQNLLFIGPNDRRLNYYRAIACNNLATILAMTGKRADEMLVLMREAHASVALALKSKPDFTLSPPPNMEREFVLISVGLEALLHGVGLEAEARRIATEARAVWKGKPEIIFEAACNWASQLKRLTPPAAGQEKQRAIYARRCVESLREAVANGYRDIDGMMADPNLAVLRSEPAFHQWLLTVKRNTEPGSATQLPHSR